MLENSQLYNFFFADGYRIAINCILLIGIILFILVIYKTFRENDSKFNILFLLMINVMISGILSPIGYLFNWKISNDNSSDKKLLFGDSNGALCQTQSFLIAFGQTSRETFLTLLSFRVLWSYCHEYRKNKFVDSKQVNKSKDSRCIKIFLIQFLGYLIPFIANIVYLFINVFGESHLFCYIKLDKNEYTELVLIIHHIYLLILIVLSLIFTIIILICEICSYNNYKNDPWLEDASTLEIKNDAPKLKKIIYYPFAQVISMSIPTIYRLKEYSNEEITNDNILAGPAAIINAISSILYILIFIFSNNIFQCGKKGNENKNKNIMQYEMITDDEKMI